MTDEKKVGGKLTEQQLAMGIEHLEKRAVVERKQPIKKPKPPVKEAAAKLLQKIAQKPVVMQENNNTAQDKLSNIGANAKTPIANSTQNVNNNDPTKTTAPTAQIADRKPQSDKKPTHAPKMPQAQKTVPPNQEAAKLPAQTSASAQRRRGGRTSTQRKNDRQNQPIGATIELSEAGKQKESALQEAAKIEESRQQNQRGRTRRKGEAKDQRKPPVRIVPLGGLHEVGKNVTAYECQGDMFIVDCGMTFPDDQMLGVDLVLPDFTYIQKNKDRLKGIVITHGHEDHIGALPYFLKDINVPVYATKLTLGLIENKLREHGLYGKVKLVQIAPKETIKLGCMEVEFIRVNHSIPDAVALAIHTPAGIIVQTGDFKIDYTPIMGDIIDLARFGELGSHGVLALLADSTNAERPGFTPTEQKVADGFDKLFKQAVNKRILIATFSSNIYRVQLICETAARFGRRVAVSGRSMVNVVEVASELGYLKPPEGVMIDIDDINKYPLDQIVIITTGSQGEPMSALSRMASCDHRKVSITPNDFIIISATPIPGNEKTVGRVVNDLMMLGADVIYERMYDVHVSGHACQEELKIMLALTRPKFFFPVHGEYKQLAKHAKLASAMGIADDHIFIGNNGWVFELDGVSVKTGETVTAGRVLVDGLGVGDVGSIVLRDRKHLGEDGLIVIVIAIERATGRIMSGPDIISRGFVYVREAEAMLTEAREVARKTFENCKVNNVREWGNIKTQVRDALSSYIYSRTKRSPMILPVIQEI